MEVDYFMQHVHTHSFKISEVLKTRYSNYQEKLQNYPKAF